MALMQARTTANGKPFSGQLQRDSYHLRPPMHVTEGLRYWGGVANARSEDFPSETVDREQPMVHKVITGTQAVSEFIAWNVLFRGTAMRTALEELAADPLTPVVNVYVERGLAGPPDAAKTYEEHLEQIRAMSDSQHAPWVGQYMDGWGHGDLLNPFGMAAHLALLAETANISANA